jgi:hypothetical protein
MAAMISGIGPLTLREIDTPALLLDLDTLPQWHLYLNGICHLMIDEFDATAAISISHVVTHERRRGRHGGRRRGLWIGKCFFQI